MIKASRTIKNNEGLFVRELDLELFQTAVGKQVVVVYGINLDNVEFNNDQLRTVLKKLTGGFVPIITMKTYADYMGWNLADAEACQDKQFPQKITLSISNTHKAKWKKVELGPHPYQASLLALTMKVEAPFEAPKAETLDIEKARIAMELHKASKKTFDIALDSINKVYYGWGFTAEEFTAMGKCWIKITDIADTEAPITEDQLNELEAASKEKAEKEKAEIKVQMEKMGFKEEPAKE